MSGKYTIVRIDVDSPELKTMGQVAGIVDEQIKSFTEVM
jgi:hypothetical protein